MSTGLIHRHAVCCINLSLSVVPIEAVCEREMELIYILLQMVDFISLALQCFPRVGHWNSIRSGVWSSRLLGADASRCVTKADDSTGRAEIVFYFRHFGFSLKSFKFCHRLHTLVYSNPVGLSSVKYKKRYCDKCADLSFLWNEWECGPKKNIKNIKK